MADPTADLVLPPARGRPRAVVVPASELVERFSRSSGPGGQSVNTADSRVELRFDVDASTALFDYQRDRLRSALGNRLIDGSIVVIAAEYRSQLRNRAAARARLADLLVSALAPPAPARRDTRPSRAAMQRRVEARKRRAGIKAGRGRIRPD